MQNIYMNIQDFLNWLSLPHARVNDIIDIIIVSIIIYEVVRWIRNTRAWVLFKGLLVIVLFTLLAMILQLHTILWILERFFSIGVTAAIIIFQPELRRVLESLGRKNVITSFFNFETPTEEAKFNQKNIQAIAKACVDMGKVKTGALIVIERDDKLSEIERTGIPVDAKITSQLLINIFEHNTPLHDGAVLIRNDRIVAATCYLPLSDNLEIGKDLGTRHRAAIGMSEVSDSLIIAVSEETGGISLAEEGRLRRHLTGTELKEAMKVMVETETEAKKFMFWKGRDKHEENNNEAETK